MNEFHIKESLYIILYNMNEKPELCKSVKL